ncbi:Hypothetical predicted protein [Pelobates cultripes]|uniref:Uncharacterized protein n=1 Tax=Pelobates cultripes TaxID=61616 RepID=A0AAD1SMP6_PELCU|nr:Hypothetical predicted protein [Pelobates cultripes]
MDDLADSSPALTQSPLQRVTATVRALPIEVEAPTRAAHPPYPSTSPEYSLTTDTHIEPAGVTS